jgi:Helix-turn-helix domain
VEEKVTFCLDIRRKFPIMGVAGTFFLGAGSAHYSPLPLCGGLMSWRAVTWVLENSEATLGSRLVLVCIASHANREGKNAFPSLDTIAIETLMSRREIIYSIQSMEELGELVVKRGIGRGNPNHYELPKVAAWLEKVQQLHQLEKIKGATKKLKGAISARKGAISASKSDLKSLECSDSETERLEPSKAITVKAVSCSLSIPEPSKPISRAEIEAQKEELRRRGYLQ